MYKFFPPFPGLVPVCFEDERIPQRSKPKRTGQAAKMQQYKFCIFVRCVATGCCDRLRQFIHRVRKTNLVNDLLLCVQQHSLKVSGVSYKRVLQYMEIKSVFQACALSRIPLICDFSFNIILFCQFEEFFRHFQENIIQFSAALSCNP